MMEAERAIKTVIEMGAEYVDVRIERERSTVIEMKDGVLRDATVGLDLGAGIRVLFDGSWGFYTTNDISKLKDGVLKAFKLAKAHKNEKKVKILPSEPLREEFVLRVREPVEDVGIDEKISLIEGAHKALKMGDERIKNASVHYRDSVIEREFLSSDGSDIRMHLCYISMGLRAVASEGGDLQEAQERLGAFTGFELIRDRDLEEVAGEVTRRALRLLDARTPPAGKLPIVMDGKLLGVFVHEALGHAAEADLVIAGESILSGRIGEKIGSEVLRIYDDPSIPHTHGYYPFDDEGVRSRRTVIIEDGILKSYLQTRSSAAELGMSPTANARAEDYSQVPIARMSNILIEQGDFGFEELIEDIKMGIYAKGMRGGQVDTVGGNFQFTAEEAFLILDGELRESIRNLSLAGSTLEVLRKIDGLGKEVTGSIGFCGKNGQHVPVSESGPDARVSEMLVGGINA
ncbi:MAG: TldD/PmbA family protein [Candidatus Syntrophoarchaeum sp. WYZ-LMO15]|nr:MAG: TldD/PmbA family protein [Candidatus Syntrophoarchaeum sp. WYZ-LMO15]